MADVISIQGIQKQDGSVVSWRDFASMSPAQQRAVMTAAGLTAQEGQQLQADLARNRNITWVDKPGPSLTPAQQQQMNQQQGLSPDTPWQPQIQQEWVDPAYGQLAAQVQGEAAAAKRQKQLAQESGVGTDPPAAATTNAPGQQTVGGQQILDYYNNIMAPAMANYQHMVQGDMAQWGDMIGKIQGATKGADVNFSNPNLQTYGQLMQMAGTQQLLNQAFTPAFNQLAQMYSQNTQINAANELQGAKFLNFMQAVQSSPQLQAFANAYGLGGLSTGLTNLTGNLTGMNLTPTAPTATNTAASNVAAATGQAALSGSNNPQNKQLTG